MKLSPEQEENRKEALVEFQETYEYPMGDTFIFSLFGDEEGVHMAITPLSYWDNEQCQYDGDLSDVIALPKGFEEESECTYLYDGDIKGAISKLVAIGFKFSLNFHKFMIDKIDDIVMVEDISLGQYMEKYYPDHIVLG